MPHLKQAQVGIAWLKTNTPNGRFKVLIIFTHLWFQAGRPVTSFEPPQIRLLVIFPLPLH